MKFFTAMAALLAIVAGVPSGSSASAQTPPAANRAQVSGTVTSVSADANKLSLKSDKGEEVSVTTNDHTLILRIPPGETDPKKGSKIALSTLAAGDRAVIIGPAPTDPKTWAATAVLIMSKSDVASLQQKDQDDWKKRGTTGTVTALDPAAKTVTIKSGSRNFTVQPSEKTSYHRYSLDSARFSDAKPSTFQEIKIGDQLRVLGNKSEDGAAILAEKVAFGTFRQIAATVTAINLPAGEMTVKDLATKKTLVIKIDADSTVRKLPEMTARMLARRYAPGAQQGDAAGGGAGRGSGGGAPGAGRGAMADGGAPGSGRGGMGGAGGGMGRGPGGGGRGGGDINQMLDSLPAMPISDFKAGDAIMVSTTQGTEGGRATVIMLLAGVEPLLTASPTATRDIMSGWNLGGGGGDTGQ
jgi:hypothetical protein